MVYMTLWRVLFVAVAAAVAWGLMRALGPWAGLLAWAGLSGAGVLLAVGLLRASDIGRLTWKNRVAAWLMPWGMGLLGRTLTPMAVTSWGVWVAIGVGVALLTRAGPTVGEPSRWAVLLFAGWAIDLAALVAVGGIYVRNYAGSGGSAGRSLLKLMGMLGLLIAGSTALWLTGQPRAAALLALGPRCCWASRTACSCC